MQGTNWVKVSDDKNNNPILYELRNDWRKVVGLSGAYEVNSQGKVRSLPKKVVRSNGTIQRFKGTVLSIFNNSSGYPCVRISDSETGKRFILRCHRAVAEAFIPNPDNKPEVNHIDGDKSNSDLSNLEWVTPKENRKHAWDIGLRNTSHLPNKIGEEKINAKLTDEKVIEMRKLRLSGMTFGSIASIYNVSKNTCINAIKGKTWAHVKPLPPMPEGE
ncbi:HNH endonuclease [Providencia rettgeri]